MIVWLNGAFGVGKTSAASELVGLLPRARVYDPERLGWILQRTVGLSRPGDFQHLRSWRRRTVRLIHRAARRGATVVVPMSVLRPVYVDELLAGLRAHGHEVHHVHLDTPVSVLQARIAGDRQTASAASWRGQHIEVHEKVKSSLAARGITVDTSTRTSRQVAAIIATALTGVGHP